MWVLGSDAEGTWRAVQVGSGTDPVEGAALAGALLERCAAGAGLTYATTHHAELKQLAAGDARFMNASVEFDLATLRPTYRWTPPSHADTARRFPLSRPPFCHRPCCPQAAGVVAWDPHKQAGARRLVTDTSRNSTLSCRLLWGQAGASNALAIAEGLGFDSRVVAAARQMLAGAAAAPDQEQQAASLMASLRDQLAQAQRQVSHLLSRAQAPSSRVQYGRW